ncbi:MAG: beta-ketoacyl-ACP synthase III [Chloroflexota bacterium]
MEKKYGRIVGWGSYVPEKILTNYDLEKVIDTTHEWIVQRTGIHERRVVAPEETTATMSTNAANRAIESAGILAEDIDLIILATSTPDYLAPSVASQVQFMIGADAPAFTLMTGCTGFVYGINIAQQFIETGVYKTILLIGAELLSRFVDWNDRGTCVLFGDGAGAVIIQASHQPSGVLGFDMGSDGTNSDAIIRPGGGSARPLTAESMAAGEQYLKMNGREVFKFATRVVGPSCQRALAQTSLTLDEIDWIVPHQANLRIIQSAARSMGVPLEKFIVTVDRFANTSAASIPIAFVDGLSSGKIKPTDTILLASFGAGLTWASAVVQLVPQNVPVQEERLVAEFAD